VVEWEIRKFRGPMTAKNATKLERRIAVMLHRHGITTTGESGIDESHTTWSEVDFPVKSLKKLIKMADDDAT
jgi:hypothetical protein